MWITVHSHDIHIYAMQKAFGLKIYKRNAHRSEWELCFFEKSSDAREENLIRPHALSPSYCTSYKLQERFCKCKCALMMRSAGSPSGKMYSGSRIRMFQNNCTGAPSQMRGRRRALQHFVWIIMQGEQSCFDRGGWMLLVKISVSEKQCVMKFFPRRTFSCCFPFKFFSAVAYMCAYIFMCYRTLRGWKRGRFFSADASRKSPQLLL
jgi:hypothetical protein